MKARHIAIIAIVSAVAGGLATWFLPAYFQRRIATDWKQLSAAPYGLTSQALFHSDIPLPAIKKLDGKAKFVDLGGGKMHLGYLITATVDKLDKSKLPEKYRPERTVIYKGKLRGRIMPIDEVNYEVKFTFRFEDNDGFELLKITSSPQNLTSGMENRFQSISEEPIPENIALRTNRITLHTSVEKCLTCK